MLTNIYSTRDERQILLMNIYPALKTKALAFFGCSDDPKAIGETVRKWDAFALEDAMNRTGLQATVVARRSFSRRCKDSTSSHAAHRNQEDCGQRPGAVQR
jgi:hypothetical protein